MLKNFFALGVSQTANFLLPFATMPILIVRVGVEGFGKVQFAYTFLLLLGFVVDYSHNITAPRDIAMLGVQDKSIHMTVGRILFTRIIMAIIVAIIIIAALFCLPKFGSEWPMYAMGYSIVLGFALQTNWFYQGIEQMSYIAYANIFGKIATFLLIIFFVKNGCDYVLVPFFWGIGNMISSCILFFIMTKKFKIEPQFRVALIREEIKNGASVFLSNVSVITYMNAGVVILGMYVNDTQLGLYSIGERIIMAVRQILGVYSQVIYPRICKLILIGWKETIQYITKIFLPFLVVVFLGCCLLYLFSSTWVCILAQQQMPESVRILQEMSPIPFIVCLNIPAYQLLMAYNIKSGYVYLMIGGAVLFVFLSTILSRFQGADGTVFSIIIVESCLTIGLYVSLFKNRKKMC